MPTNLKNWVGPDTSLYLEDEKSSERNHPSYSGRLGFMLLMPTLSTWKRVTLLASYSFYIPLTLVRRLKLFPKSSHRWVFRVCLILSRLDYFENGRTGKLSNNEVKKLKLGPKLGNHYKFLKFPKDFFVTNIFYDFSIFA